MLIFGAGGARRRATRRRKAEPPPEEAIVTIKRYARSQITAQKRLCNALCKESGTTSEDLWNLLVSLRREADGEPPDETERECEGDAHTRCENPGEKNILLALANIPFETRLAQGTAPWDGSEARHDAAIKSIRERIDPARIDAAIRDMVDHRRGEAEDFAARARDYLKVEIDGRDAAVTSGSKDDPTIRETVWKNGLARLPYVFHSLIEEDRVGVVRIFRAVVSSAQRKRGGVWIRREKFVIARADVRAIRQDEHLVDDLRTAIERAKIVDDRSVDYDCAKRAVAPPPIWVIETTREWLLAEERENDPDYPGDVEAIVRAFAPG